MGHIADINTKSLGDQPLLFPKISACFSKFPILSKLVVKGCSQSKDVITICHCRQERCFIDDIHNQYRHWVSKCILLKLECSLWSHPGTSYDNVRKYVISLFWLSMTAPYLFDKETIEAITPLHLNFSLQILMKSYPNFDCFSAIAIQGIYIL